MAIEDYLPNIFGSVPSAYQGLLGTEESAALQKRSNIGGLLSAGAALAQGMSAQGPRRSALQNVLGALAAGYTGAGQAGVASIEQMVNAQKLGQTQQQIAALNKVLTDPNIDDATKAFIRSNPQDGLKMIAEMQMFQKQREKFMPQAAPAEVSPQLQVEGMPAVQGTKNPEIDKLEQQIQSNLADASAYSAMRDPVKAEASTRIAERLRERQMQLSAGDIDLEQRINSAPEQFKDQYKAIQSLKGSLKPNEIISAVQKVDQAVQESSKQYKYEGIVGQYAYQQFGTNDASKLTPEQRKNVLAYANAPTQADQTKIAIDAQRLKFETGGAPALPTSREQMLGGVAPQAPSQPVAPQAVAPQPAAQPTSQAAQQPAPVVKPATTNKAVDINVTPLVNKPDNIVTPKKKQELFAAQPSTINLAGYTLKNVVDSRDSAQKLLDNPKYIEALSGTTAPYLAKIPGTDAFTANELLKNLLGRSFVNELQQMRQASPTGGAVGNVAVAEMDSLSKIQAALTVGMDKNELRNQLQQYINSTKRAIKTIPNEYARTYGYNGEFDEVLGGTVVEKPTSGGLPPGVTVRRK